MPLATSKRASIAIIAACQVAAIAVWFSASAVAPALAAEFHLSNFARAALTSGVQVGFVIGCLVSAFMGLPDRVDPRGRGCWFWRPRWPPRRICAGESGCGPRWGSG